MVALLFGACSSSRKVQGTAPEGELAIHVRAITDVERVEALRVTLQPTDPGAPLVVWLEEQANGDWSQKASSLPVGTYTAVAAAFAKAPDDPSFDENADLLFRSSQTSPFSITEGGTTPVFLFLHQDLDGQSFEVPHFTSIVFGGTPAVGQAVEIIAKGGGGDGSLQLGGSGHGGFANGSGDAASPAGATIEWTPDASGLRQIMLHLEDGKGNRATVALQVEVSAEGEVEFNVFFNHSPWVTYLSDIDNWEASAEVSFTLTFGDDVEGQIDYELDFTACNAAGLVFDPTNSDPPTGTALRGGSKGFVLSATDGQQRSCTVDIVLTDRGAAPARQTQTLTLNTEFIASSCAQGLTDCFGVCVNLGENDEHCGACGNACPAGHECNGGTCESICGPGLEFCDGSCVDLQTSDQHCGSCDNVCGLGETCDDGACGPICDPGMLFCDDSCVDPSTDPSHCGDCETVCTGGKVCSGGDCLCPGGMMDCSGACIDTTDNDEHCGVCDNACGNDQYCSGTTCVCSAPGYTNCAGTCVDLQADPNFCGSCGMSCGGGQVCENGSCVTPSCPAGQTLCGGTCVDTGTDPNHCGGCDQACNQHDPCVGGVCYPDPEWANWPVPSEDPTPGVHYDYTTDSNIVHDLVTGLMWQRYVPAGAVTQAQAKQACADLNLGGYTDWRLPTRIELISITRLTNGGQPQVNPAINSLAFPNTPAEAFWTSSDYLYPPAVGDPPGPRVWMVSFSLGNAGRGQPGGLARYRCVRFGPNYPTRAELHPNHYTDHGSYITDNWTGLHWEKGSYVDRPVSANNACNTLNFGGYTSMLPFRKQLETLVDVRTINPALSGASWSYHNDEYWTRTYRGTDGYFNYYWIVDFRSGRTNYDAESYYLATRCVAGPYL